MHGFWSSGQPEFCAVWCALDGKLTGFPRWLSFSEVGSGGGGVGTEDAVGRLGCDVELDGWFLILRCMWRGPRFGKELDVSCLCFIA